MLLDLALVVAFIGISRISHQRSLTPTGVWDDVWPFLVGVLVGWLVTRSWRDPLTEVSALGVWACTMLGGFIPRFFSPPHPRLADTVVAGMVLAFVLGGWRLYAFLVQSLRRRRANGLPVD